MIIPISSQYRIRTDEYSWGAKGGCRVACNKGQCDQWGE